MKMRKMIVVALAGLLVQACGYEMGDVDEAAQALDRVADGGSAVATKPADGGASSTVATTDTGSGVPVQPPPGKPTCTTSWRHNILATGKSQGLYDASCKWARGKFWLKEEKLWEWKRSGGPETKDSPGQYANQVAKEKGKAMVPLRAQVQQILASERAACPPECKFDGYFDPFTFWDSCQDVTSMAGTVWEHLNHTTAVIAKTIVHTECRP